MEFQLFRRKDGAFVFDSSAQGKPDASGRATVKVAIHKEYSEADTFRIQVRHGDSPWSNGRNTDRDVRETAEDVFDHKAVSGIHFPENSSFIVPTYLKTFRELDKTFTDWRRTHPNARLVVFGHAERNEEDPRKLSERRAKIAFAFLIGDHFTWGRIAQEEKWGVWEQQHMLQAMGFYEGKTDGIRGPKTDKAILDFITWLNETECKGINPMLGFTEEYIQLELYRVYISGSKRAVSIPSGNYRTVSGSPYVGCTAFNRYHGGDGNHGENRRTTFLMLEESLSFPVIFPCRSTVGPCEAEAGKAGERAVKGFKCGFYDGIMKAERAGAGFASDQLNKSETLVWGQKVSVEFRKKVRIICSELGFDPNFLMACMAFESGLSPSIQNKYTKATGLIQFMPSTAKSLGTTLDDLKSMTAEAQLDYVHAYFRPYTGKIHTLEDAYMVILWPVAVGKSPGFALFKNGTEAYEQNSGLDLDKDGVVTKYEAAEKVRKKLIQGESCKA